MDPMIDVDALTESVYGGDVVRSLLFSAADEPGRRVVRLAVASAEPGRGGQRHHHPDTDETYFVIEGQAVLDLADERHELGPGSCARIPRGTVHRISNTGTATLRYLAFHSGPTDFDGPVKHVKEA